MTVLFLDFRGYVEIQSVENVYINAIRKCLIYTAKRHAKHTEMSRRYVTHLYLERGNMVK